MDLVIHRNGEPDPCSRQDVTPKEDAMEDAAALSPTSLALLHAVDNLGGRKKPLDENSNLPTYSVYIAFGILMYTYSDEGLLGFHRRC